MVYSIELFLPSYEDVAEADVRLTPNTGKVKVTLQLDGSFKAEVQITWKLDPDESSIDLPQWTWPGQDKDSWKTFIDALQAHEEGHMTIGEQLAKEQSGTQSATGDSESAAMVELQNQLSQHKQDVMDLLDRCTKEYDEKTDHGHNQAAAGGTNVRLNCP